MGNEQKKVPSWKKDKRSWIFYLDKISDDDRMIWGRTDDGIYLLDCKTAQLLLWTEKWNIFTEVGVSALLEQIDNAQCGKIQQISRGTRILYKGIELQNTYLEQDTELLEYIDIKGELSNEYINISRSGFTEKGEHYFKEKIYPELLSAIRNALNEIKKRDNFVCKIKLTVSELCQKLENLEKNNVSEELEAVQKELISVIVTSAVLSYYAMREEWNIMEELEEEQETNNIWKQLVAELDKELESHKIVLGKLAEKSVLFNITVLSEESQEQLVVRKSEGDKTQQIVHFLKIFLPENHWAILQERKNQFEAWTLYLVLLDSQKKGKNSCYKQLTALPHIKKDEDELEVWGKSLCELLLGDERKTKIGYSYGQQILLNWMRKSIPTVGMFSTKEGNIRINILSNRIYPSIFVNQNFKTLILQKVIEFAEKEDIKRFSTITWQGQERIGFEKLPFSVYFVKRGYLSQHSYRKSIIPVDGELLKKWGEIIENKNQSTIVRQIEKLCKDMDIEGYLHDYYNSAHLGKESNIKRYFQNDVSGAILNISAELLSTVQTKIINMGFKPLGTLEELLNDEGQRAEKWHRMYEIYAELQAREHLGVVLDDDEKLWEELKEKADWDSLCNAWIYCGFLEEEMAQSACETSQEFSRHMEKQIVVTAEKNMLRYMRENLPYSVPPDVLRRAFEDCKQEWCVLVEKIEKQYVKDFIEKLWVPYGIFKKNLEQAYDDYKRKENG